MSKMNQNQTGLAKELNIQTNFGQMEMRPDLQLLQESAHMNLKMQSALDVQKGTHDPSKCL